MKLYVKDKNSHAKVYIRASAPDRKELVKKLGGVAFVANGNRYLVHEVSAEKSTDNTGIGMLVGGIIGTLGGAGGLVAGGALGALFGKEQDKKEAIEADIFNRSEI